MEDNAEMKKESSTREVHPKYNSRQSYEAYREKAEELDRCLTRVTAREMYDDIYPDSDLERPGHPDDGRANMIIAYSVNNDGTDGWSMRNEILFAGKAGLECADKADFAVCGMCTYSGRRRTAAAAYKCHGYAFDLDGVGLEELRTVLLAIEEKVIPCPQYIVNSGHGLHLYYIFERPVPLYASCRYWLQRLKYALTRVIWTRETSYLKPRPDRDTRDYLGIYQCMRMPGSCSKIGRGKAKKRYLVTAYRYNTYTGARCSLTYLNQWVNAEDRVPESADYSSWDYDHVSLSEAEKLYPAWYQRRIIDGAAPGQWVCSHALYDWWLDLIQRDTGARDGTRYNCVAVLFIYAIKCRVPYDEVMSDAMQLVPLFDARTVKPDNAFTAADVMAASKYYKPSYSRFSIKAIEAKTHIMIPRRLHHYRPQAVHLARARAVEAIDYPHGEWRNTAGAPDKKAIVAQWRMAHPDGRKIDCERDTGLSRHTVIKWW